MRRVLIVGASAAGLSTAEALRRRGFDGQITIVGEEPRHAYDRPPLSKQVLSGEWDEGRALLFPLARLERIDADLQLGRKAVSADLGARTVRLDDGETAAYDELVIATGVRPRTLPGSEAEGVFVLRTLEHAQALAAAIRQHRRLVIVGAGFLGLEVAATARKVGAEVTVVEPVSVPLANRLGSYTARRLVDLHIRSGVDIRAGVVVESIVLSDDHRTQGVRTPDGQLVEAPIVLVAVGCVPNVEWLHGTELDLEDGVGCDEACRAAPHVWAAGDIARWHHPGLGRQVRLEHRMNASEQGSFVAANIMGAERAFAPVPFFWTDHYDTKVQLAGVIPPGVVERSEVDEDDSFVRTFWAGDRLMGVVGWNAAKAMMPFRRLLDLSEPMTVSPGCRDAAA
jgi:3-phenylpropionate/trans-cinnamate dioxygenase ferredoxin reductase subunit